MRMKPHDTIPYDALPRYSDEVRLDRARAFFEALKTRRTCRDFADTPVSRDVIEVALLAAGTAPSGANHQPWHFAVITSPEKKRALREAAEVEEREFYAGKASQEWIDALAPLGTDEVKPYLETAPYLIVIFGQRRGGLNPGDDKQNYYVNESVGIATGFLIAALHDAGLCNFNAHAQSDEVPESDLRAASEREASDGAGGRPSCTRCLGASSCNDQEVAGAHCELVLSRDRRKQVVRIQAI